MTLAPGRIAASELVITLSPTCRPSLICQREPCMAPVVTWRASTVSPSPSSITLAWPSAERCTARCGTRMAFWLSPCGVRTRTYIPGSNTPSGLSNCPRRAICPVLRSTEISVNSSVPLLSISVPSTRSDNGWSLAPATLPSAMAARRRRASAAGWVKSAYTGSSCWIRASRVASPWPTSAPSVTWARPMRPAMGARTSA